MVEHNAGSVKVIGSIPVSSIKKDHYEKENYNNNKTANKKK